MVCGGWVVGGAEARRRGGVRGVGGAEARRSGGAGGRRGLRRGGAVVCGGVGGAEARRRGGGGQQESRVVVVVRQKLGGLVVESPRTAAEVSIRGTT